MTAAQKVPVVRHACPSLAEPMVTGDGLLVRLKPIPSGLSPHQWQALADAALQFGNGRLEISSRGNIQVRGLRAETVPRLVTAMAAAEITFADGPAIDSHPLAGARQSGDSAISDLTDALRHVLSGPVLSGPVLSGPVLSGHVLSGSGDGQRLTQSLAAKTSIVIDGAGPSGRADMLADLIADLRFNKDPAGWQVRVGGTQLTGRLIGCVDQDAALPFAVEALKCIAAHGPQARGRDLDDGDVDHLSAHGLQTIKTPAAAQIKPLQLGVMALAQDKWALSLQPAFGALDGALLKALARQLIGFEGAVMHAAAGKKLLIEPLTKVQAGRLQADLATLGFVVSDSDQRQQFLTCVGAPGCASAHLNTHAMAQKLAAKPPAADSKTAVIHVSGCPKACARPAKFDAEILSHADGVTITYNRVTPASDGLRKWLTAAVNDRFTGPTMDQRTP